MMNAFMEITILWIIMYRAGQCEPRETIEPTMIENQQERTYECKFNETVDCLWQKNGITSSIRPYRYVEGDGRNTKDCSIVANKNKPKLNVECVGLLKSTLIQITISGGSTQLNCSSDTKIMCSWKRNESVVNFDNVKYKYTGEHDGNDVTDCSITLVNTTAIDAGRWDCLGKTTSETNSEAKIFVTFDLQWTPSSTTGAGTTSSNTDGKTSKADIPATTPSTSKDDRGKEKRMVAYLSSACAVIVVLMGVIIYLRKRQITNRRISKTYSEQQLDMENNAAPDHKVAGKVQGDEEHTYGNISKGQATPSALEYKQEQPPLTQFGQPDADQRSTEIVYTEVVISLRNPVNSTNSLPISQIERTTYATILPKTITEDIPNSDDHISKATVEI